jgi:hypothetical protein
MWYALLCLLSSVLATSRQWGMRLDATSMPVAFQRKATNTLFDFDAISARVAFSNEKHYVQSRGGCDFDAYCHSRGGCDFRCMCPDRSIVWVLVCVCVYAARVVGDATFDACVQSKEHWVCACVCGCMWPESWGM